jgi:hypothetical protein
MMNGESRVSRLAHSARWFVFAKRADDRRRERYWRILARLRKSELERRRSSLSHLPVSPVEVSAETGFTTLDPGAIDTSAVLAEVRRLRQQLTLGRRGDEKPYMLDHSIVDLEPLPGLRRFALDPTVVATAARYLGMVPVLTGITLLASPHVEGPFSGSQLFHSDWEDVRQVKVFVLCSPVADKNGPLTAVRAQASRRVKDAVHYRYGGQDFRLPDDSVLPLVAADEVTAFTGQSGTVTFIDTSSCLHLGSRVKDGAEERLVVQFQYLTPPAFDLVLAFGRRRPFASVHASTPVDRLVLG